MRKNEDGRFEDAFAQIMRHFNEDAPLSEALAARLARWKSAREFMLTIRPLTDSSVVDFLLGSYAISEPQAWRDVRDTKRFFASMERTNQEYDRIMLIAQVRDLRAKAMAKGNYKVAAQCDANLQKMGVADSPEEDAGVGKTIQLLVGFNPKRVGAKEIPNLLEQVEQFIGEAARRELMMDTEQTWNQGKP